MVRIMIECYQEHLARELEKLVHCVQKLCWFHIWQSICSQSNFWVWTIKGCHKLLKGHQKKTVGSSKELELLGSSDWVRESFIDKTKKLTAWFLHALEYCLCIDRWLSLQIRGVFFSFSIMHLGHTTSILRIVPPFLYREPPPQKPR